MSTRLAPFFLRNVTPQRCGELRCGPCVLAGGLRERGYQPIHAPGPQLEDIVRQGADDATRRACSYPLRTPRREIRRAIRRCRRRPIARPRESHAPRRDRRTGPREGRIARARRPPAGPAAARARLAARCPGRELASTSHRSKGRRRPRLWPHAKARTRRASRRCRASPRFRCRWVWRHACSDRWRSMPAGTPHVRRPRVETAPAAAWRACA